MTDAWLAYTQTNKCVVPLVTTKVCRVRHSLSGKHPLFYLVSISTHAAGKHPFKMCMLLSTHPNFLSENVCRVVCKHTNNPVSVGERWLAVNFPLITTAAKQLYLILPGSVSVSSILFCTHDTHKWGETSKKAIHILHFTCWSIPSYLRRYVHVHVH